jgi:hypothetical protein
MESIEKTAQRLNRIRKDRKINTDPLAGLNITEEYSLIQQKRSQLSVALRQLVINRFEVGKVK